MARAPDYVAGNVRLRARLPQLADLEAESDPVRLAELRREQLRRVRPAFTADAHPVVAVLLARHDLADVLALLRGALRRRPPAERLAAVEAVGTVTPEAAADVAAAGDGAAAVARLQTARLPDPAVAAELGRIWTAYELHGDAEELEVDLAGAAHRHWDRRLQSYGRAAQPVRDLLAEERDRVNLRTTLRVGGGGQPRLLPPGRLGADALAAAARGDWARVALLRPEWRSALPTSHPTSAAALEAGLRQSLLDRLRPRLRMGDLFGAEVLVAYVICVETVSASRAADAVRGAG